MDAQVNHHLDRKADAIAANTQRDDDALIDTRALAAWLGCSEVWIEVGRSRNHAWGPPVTRIGRLCRYRVGTVREWLRERTFAAERKRSRRLAA
jgi:hypothetical protein